MFYCKRSPAYSAICREPYTRELPKIRGPLFGGLYNKDPTFLEYYTRAPLFSETPTKKWGEQGCRPCQLIGSRPQITPVRKRKQVGAGKLGLGFRVDFLCPHC